MKNSPYLDRPTRSETQAKADRLAEAAPETAAERDKQMSPTEFRAARLALGLSVKDMAEALGISEMHVRRLETPPDRARHKRVPLWHEKAVKRLRRSNDRDHE